MRATPIAKGQGNHSFSPKDLTVKQSTSRSLVLRRCGQALPRNRHRVTTNLMLKCIGRGTGQPQCQPSLPIFLSIPAAKAPNLEFRRIVLP